MPRHPSIPQRLFYALALPAFVLYTALLHVWCVWMAFHLSDASGPGIATLALPVASWFYWLDKIPVDSVRAGFASSVAMWFVSAALLLAAHVANRRFPVIRIAFKYSVFKKVFKNLDRVPVVGYW